LPIFWASNLYFFKSLVVNVSDPDFFQVKKPEGFIWQELQSPRLQIFRAELPDKLKFSRPSLQKAIAICHWVRMQQAGGESWIPHHLTLRDRFRGDSEDPTVILQAQRNGFSAVCKRFAYLMVGAAESTGMQARVITFTDGFSKPNGVGHVITEIWVPELRKWVLMDPMWDLMFTINGAPASAMDIYTAVHNGKVRSILTAHHGTLQNVTDPLGVKREFQHLYVAMSNAVFDGYQVCFSCDKPITFAHLSSGSNPSYPTALKGTAFALGSISIISGICMISFSAFELAKRRCMKGSWLRKSQPDTACLSYVRKERTQQFTY
jgi:hypothetical protein